jgi:uncharacterized protein
MKLLLLYIIKIYWLIPKDKRRQCLFKLSCSHYVYKITREKGFVAGIGALRKRYSQCKPGYAIYETDGTEWVILKDTSIIKRELTNL